MASMYLVDVKVLGVEVVEVMEVNFARTLSEARLTMTYAVQANGSSLVEVESDWQKMASVELACSQHPATTVPESVGACGTDVKLHAVWSACSGYRRDPRFCQHVIRVK